MGGGHNDSTVGKKVFGKRQMPGPQRLFGDDGAETRAIDEDIAFDPLAAISQQRRNIARSIKLNLGNHGLQVDDATAGTPFAKEIAEFVGIEMIAVTGCERKISSRVWAFASAGKRRREEPCIGVGRHVDAGTAQEAVRLESWLGM